MRSHIQEGRNTMTGPKVSRTSYVLRKMAGHAVAVTRVSFGRVAANVLATGCPPGKRVIRIRGGRERAGLFTAQAKLFAQALDAPHHGGESLVTHSAWSRSGL